jgi:hypothetical protein
MDVQCQTWHTLTLPSGPEDTTKQNTVTYCQVGPGWKPPPSMLAAAIKGRQPKPTNPYVQQWTAVPLMVGGDGPTGTGEATVLHFHYLLAYHCLLLRFGCPDMPGVPQI